MTARRGPARAAAVVAMLAAVVALGSLLAACGGDDDSVRSGGRETSERTTPAGGTPDSTSPAYARSYVGMTKRAAIDKANAEDRTWRIVREDDERFPVTLDYNPERLNFEVDDGRITTVTYG